MCSQCARGSAMSLEWLNEGDASVAYETIRSLVRAAIAGGQTSGAVVCIGDSERIALHEALGFRQIEPRPVPMTRETLFDLASLTKPLATGLSVMKLVEEGALEIDQLAQHYLPSFRGEGKENITLRQLLIHTSGLTPDNALADYLDGQAEAWRRIDQLPLLGEPGTKFRYSDVGFIVLGRIVEAASSLSLDQFARERIHAPSRMSSTGYCPAEEPRGRAVTTERRNGEWIQGEVHDPRAHALGGVAGHAGLFATSGDLATLAQSLLRSWRGEGSLPLKPETLRLMTADNTTPEGHRRGLGWDKQSSYSSNRGTELSEAAFGHGGFTGTSIWIDPEQDLFVIFLGNRLHPDGKGSVNSLAGEIANLASAGRAQESR